MPKSVFSVNSSSEYSDDSDKQLKNVYQMGYIRDNECQVTTEYAYLMTKIFFAEFLILILMSPSYNISRPE